MIRFPGSALSRRASFVLLGWIVLAAFPGCATDHDAAHAAAAASTLRTTPQTPPSEPRPPVTVTPQQSWDDAILYFVILDRFVDGDPTNDTNVELGGKGTFHGGDLAGLIARLDEISSLGATALWVTPVVTQIPGFVSGAGFPDWPYHGYWADDFQTVDPRFGTEAQLKLLADACHARGMKLLLDVVYNHCGYDSHYIKDKGRAWLRFGSQCGNDDLTMCLSGLPDFKTENPEVRDYLMDAHLGRARRTGIDGFRLDTVKHVSHDFWDEHRRRTRTELGHDFFLIGEVWGGDAQNLDPWFEPDEMDAGFDFGFQGSVTGFLLGRGRPVAFDHYLERRENVRAGHYLSDYLSSHDTDGALFTLHGDKDLYRLAVVLQMTAKGIPCIFYGEEVGRHIGTWPENRTDMPWGNTGILPGAGVARDEDLRTFYRKVIALRRAHPSLWRGTREGLDFGKDHLVFARTDTLGSDAVVVAVNRGDTKATATVASLAAWGGHPALIDYLTGTPCAVADGKVNLTLAPRSAQIVGPGPQR